MTNPLTSKNPKVVKGRVAAYCEACKRYIDITDMSFISYAEEEPMVLDLQLKGGASDEAGAIEFVKKSGMYSFDDYNEGEEKMYHYDKVADLSHYEAGDDTHKLVITGGYWTTQ